MQGSQSGDRPPAGLCGWTSMRVEGEGSVVKLTTDVVRGAGMNEADWREKHKPTRSRLGVRPCLVLFTAVRENAGAK